MFTSMRLQSVNYLFGCVPSSESLVGTYLNKVSLHNSFCSSYVRVSSFPSSISYHASHLSKRGHCVYIVCVSLKYDISHGHAMFLFTLDVTSPLPDCMAKGTVCVTPNSQIPKSCALVWSWSPAVCSYNSLQSSGKAFLKSLEHGCTDLLALFHNKPWQTISLWTDMLKQESSSPNCSVKHIIV